MTDNEIIKALGCLTGGFNILCHECAFNGKFPCRENAAKAALDLIKRQQAEIERLKKPHELSLWDLPPMGGFHDD